MCGIAGVWSTDPIADPLRLAERIDAALAHRGPDGHASASFDSGRLLLLHRRLAIIDPTPAGAQPMSSPDARYTIVFNGEIYNHRQLRCRLEREGESFATRSDTEVLMRLVAHSGPQALADARGMFAFAIWDARDRALLIARDRFGIKPCYLATAPGRIGFASEIRALAAGGFGDGVNPLGIHAYLRWGSIPAPLTWLKNVTAIEPGTWHRWDADGHTSGRFADVRQTWTGASADAPDELRLRTRQALHDSVAAHLVSDVPVGVFLSGGIDSAALVATASAATPALHTFTVTVDHAAHDESVHAASIARCFGTTHHTLRVDANLITQGADSFLSHIDQPTIDGVNTYVVSSAVASTGIKAVLSGLGGDEAFGGYPSFRRVVSGKKWARVPRALRLAAGRLAAYREPHWRGAKLRHAAGSASSPFELYRAVRGWMMPSEVAAIAGAAVDCDATRVELDAVERALVDANGTTESPLATVARLETTMYLRNQLLRDVDVMAMAHGLEVRVPFVDHQLVGAVWPALGQHPDLTVRKRLLVDAVEAKLPRTVTGRPKQGFTLPFVTWIDGPLSEFVRDGLADASRRRWIAQDAPDAVWFDWQNRACHWSRPWGLAVLGHFLAKVSH